MHWRLKKLYLSTMHAAHSERGPPINARFAFAIRVRSERHPRYAYLTFNVSPPLFSTRCNRKKTIGRRKRNFESDPSKDDDGNRRKFSARRWVLLFSPSHSAYQQLL